MPLYNYKCPECGKIEEILVGNTITPTKPLCSECDNEMNKIFSVSGISSDVVGGYDYEYGKKAWKRNKTDVEKAAIISGDMDPY